MEFNFLIPDTRKYYTARVSSAKSSVPSIVGACVVRWTRCKGWIYWIPGFRPIHFAMVSCTMPCTHDACMCVCVGVRIRVARQHPHTQSPSPQLPPTQEPARAHPPIHPPKHEYTPTRTHVYSRSASFPIWSGTRDPGVCCRCSRRMVRASLVFSLSLSPECQYRFFSLRGGSCTHPASKGALRGFPALGRPCTQYSHTRV